MRTGLKMLVKRLIRVVRYPYFLLTTIDSHTFPSKKTSHISRWARIYALRSELTDRPVQNNLGSLYTLPAKEATRVYKQLIDFNPGNLGSWTDLEHTSTTNRIEFEVIQKMIDLYGLQEAKMSGYVTSGGTEGNIFSLWQGRDYLQAVHALKLHKLLVLRTCLTHYSVRKAAKICMLQQREVAIDQTTWAMSPESFEVVVHSAYKRGIRGFIVPLTIGTTAVGSCDPIDVICKKIAILEKKLPGSVFYIWIDAALNGLIFPFISKRLHYLRNKNIFGLVVDFHKLGLVPYAAGILLYKQVLRSYIESSIEYLEEYDTTLLGSRSGIPAVSMWMMIHTLGKEGYRSIILKEQRHKTFFRSQLQIISKHIQVISDDESLTCGVIFLDLPNQKLPEELESKYSLYGGLTELSFYKKKKKNLVIYKFFFLPHVNAKLIVNFCRDLKKVYAKK